LFALAAQSPVTVGRKALDLLLSANYPEFTRLLSPAAKEKLTTDFLQKQVGVEVKSFGKSESVGKPLLASSGKNTLVSFPVKFSQVTINVQFTIDSTDHVAGLYFRPADAPLPPEWQRPIYSKPQTFHEIDVTIGADEWRLPGTLTMPNGKGPFIAVLLVHGPGPNDRDETIYSNRMFKDTAEGLATRGFAVLRYDKRSNVYSQQMSGGSYTLQQDTVEDAVRALNLLRTEPGINPARIFVIAHSLGGYALPRIAKQYGKLSGAVVLAGNARPIEDVVLDQATFTTQSKVNLTQEDLRRYDLLKAEVEKVKKLQPGAQDNPPVVLGLPAAYLLDLKSYNPVSEIRSLSMPILFLQGERDFQVPMKDFDTWKSGLAGRKSTTFKSYLALNHLFMAGEGKPSPTEYRVPSNVSAQVIGDIATWISRQ
jgi:pimeloyl-ACP methyl ester carboxylesterase